MVNSTKLLKIVSLEIQRMAINTSIAVEFYRHSRHSCPLTKTFLADIPASQPGARLDAGLRASNKALLDTILKEMNTSTITIVDPDGMQIFNMTGTGEIIVQIGAVPDRSLCSVSVKMPGDDIMTFMDECAGRIDRFVMNGGKREQANSEALDPVLNRIFTDVERFTQFAARMFPKNSQ